MQDVPSMVETRANQGCMVSNGHIYQIGGFNGVYTQDQLLATIDTIERISISDVKNIQNRNWELLTSRLSYGSHGGAVTEPIYDKIYIIGGFNGTYNIGNARVDVLNTITNEITHGSPLKYGVHSPATFRVGDMIFVIGGFIVRGTPTNNWKDPINTWQYRYMLRNFYNFELCLFMVYNLYIVWTRLQILPLIPHRRLQYRQFHQHWIPLQLQLMFLQMLLLFLHHYLQHHHPLPVMN